MPASLFVWLESTRMATAIGGSTLLTGLLSAMHLLGMTLVGGGALLSSLRLLGVILREQPLGEVTAAPARAIVVGLGVSATTGILLFAPRAAAAAQNEYFQIKMLLLVAAVSFHFSVYRTVRQRLYVTGLLSRMTGAVCAVLWLGVVAAGCAYILLE